MPILEGLRPPAVPISEELEWTLCAAFCRQPPEPAVGLDQDVIQRLAADLGIAERIAARAADLLPPPARDFFRQRLVTSTAICLMYEGTARQLSALAADRGIELVFLKGFALHMLRRLPAGSRSFSDLDVLVDPVDAPVLYRAVLDRGYTRHPGPPTEQHLPILRHPERGAIEIHFRLRGLRRLDGNALTLSDLDERHALVDLPELPGCRAPEESALAAHLLVHGLQQHLLRPRTYPLWRLVGDLVDLLPEDRAWDRLRERWGAALADSAPEDLVGAMQQMVANLAAAARLDLSSDSAESVLARHLIAGTLDADYADSLAPAYLSERLAEARRHGELLDYLGRKLSGPSAGGGAGALAALLSGTRRQLRALGSRFRLARRSSESRTPRSGDHPVESSRHDR